MSSPASDNKEEDRSLSELCSICYTETPKYRCPRCATRTCSLPCYKRHQQRASCSGERDPAAYRKRSQLATPAALDQDYNFLKGVERHIDATNRDVVERGIGGGRYPAASAASSAGGLPNQKAFARGMNPDGPVQQYLMSNSIRVSRAPKGMSRQRLNQTRCTKNKRIMWTVEWIDLESHTTIQNSCLESDTLADLYRALQVERANAAERKLAAANQGVPGSNFKRKRGADSKAPTVGITVPTTTTLAASERSSKVSLSHESIAKISKDQSCDPPSDRESDEDTTSEASSAVDGPVETISSSSENASGSAAQNANATAPTPSSPDPFFYLLKPYTTGAAKVLIPMDTSKTLTKSLSARVVLEFPTFYILPHSPDELASATLANEQQYITEEAYRASINTLCAQEAREAAAKSVDQASGKRRASDDGSDVLDSQSSARAGKHRSATGANATMPMSAEQRASVNAASHADDAQRARQEAASKDPNKILAMLRRDLSGMM